MSVYSVMCGLPHTTKLALPSCKAKSEYKVGWWVQISSILRIFMLYVLMLSGLLFEYSGMMVLN